jgi:hypothetical protein
MLFNLLEWGWTALLLNSVLSFLPWLEQSSGIPPAPPLSSVTNKVRDWKGPALSVGASGNILCSRRAAADSGDMEHEWDINLCSCLMRHLLQANIPSERVTALGCTASRWQCPDHGTSALQRY